MEQNFLSQIKGGGNFILQISTNDLREIMRSFYHDERKREEEAFRQRNEKPSISRKEAAKMLDVSLATLWKWAKDGYLVPVKIGTKVMYKMSDVEALLKGK